MNAWAAVVDTVHTALVIKQLVFFHKLNEEGMDFPNLFSSNVSLNHTLHAMHQLTEISPILPWKESPEESRA